MAVATDPGVALIRGTTIITLTGVGVADETVNIGDVAYTFKASPAAAYDVDIGTDATTQAAKLVAAINATGDTTAYYVTGTSANPYVSAASAAGVVTLTARHAGTTINGLKLLWTLTNGTNVDAAFSASASAVTATGSIVSQVTALKKGANAHLITELDKILSGE